MARFTLEQRKHLAGLVDKWKKKLKLDHWTISINWDEPAEEGAGLDVGVIDGRHYAIVRVGSFFDLPEDEQENAVCHELIHCVLAGLFYAGIDLAHHLGTQAMPMAIKRLEVALEYAVDHMANVMAPIKRDNIGSVAEDAD